MVAGWGAYLVPFWVRRHDGPAAELRSIQGFSTAMRTLSRRKPSYVDGRYVLMPGAPRSAAQPPAVHVSGGGSRRAVDHALARRRRVLLSLVALSVVSLPLMAFVGGRTGWLAAASMAATIGYAVVLRRESVRVDERRRRARQRARRRRLLTEQNERAVSAAHEEAAEQARRQPPMRYVAALADDVPDEAQWRRVVGQ